MTKLQVLLLGAATALAAVGPLSAHHRWPVNRSTEVTVQGTVKTYTWSNPHVMIALDVEDEEGRVQEWEVGGPSLNRMSANGWDANTLTAGDVITGTGYRFTDGSRILRLERIVTPDGTEMLLYARQ